MTRLFLEKKTYTTQESIERMIKVGRKSKYNTDVCTLADTWDKQVQYSMSRVLSTDKHSKSI